MIETIQFQSDGLTLVGTLHLPEGISKPPLVIGCHGLLADRSSAKQMALATACNADGIAYFRFDHRGRGESEGDFESVTSLNNRCADLDSAIAALAGKGRFSRLGLFGSSMGGAVCLNTAAARPIPALVTVAAPICLPPFDDSDPLPGHIPPLSHDFVKNNLRFDITGKLHRIGRILILHGEDDPVVPVSHARAIHKNASAPKRLVVFPGEDHPISHPVNQKKLVTETVKWFTHHLKDE